MFNRVLVANRGEVAVRVIRALHENDVEAVAVYSTADRDSLHVRLADRAICIGPPQAVLSYLWIPSLIAAATTTGCEAVHPGWGFVAENPAFVEACADNDLVFIGPSAEVMARMGDKVLAKAELKAADVPLVPGTEGATDLDESREAAEEVGYPVLLKATAGGGGKGMRLVQGPDELDSAYNTAALEAEAAFGDGSLYLEKAVSPARHVEIQVLADGQGGVLTLGERECSIQRRHQKLIEESPSPALDDETREAMEAAAERACHAIGYRNAGTFEFLLGPDRSFYFIELNARLQVEHPVTEMVTGIDLVREQLRIAAGAPLERTGRAARRGHSVEVRINAEDPARDFAPAPGRITRFRPPLGPGVRLDTFIEDGTDVPPHYDSLLGKLIVWDETRPEAIARTLRALGELQLEGVPTTRELAMDILRSEEFGSRLARGFQRSPARDRADRPGWAGGSGHPRAGRSGASRRASGADRGGRAGPAAEAFGRGVARQRPRCGVVRALRGGRRTGPGGCASRAGARRRGGRRDFRARSRERRRVGRGDRVVSGRRAARRTALVLLYQWDVTGQELASLFDGEVDPYARAVAEGVIEEHEDLDRRITDASDDWTADRLGALERNILRMAIRELDEGETPVEVAINEAVALAKRYSSEDAGKLVNGILGRIEKEAHA
jgi:acetyl-CoA carboxylase biotin carboxylase subunit